MCLRRTVTVGGERRTCAADRREDDRQRREDTQRPPSHGPLAQEAQEQAGKLTRQQEVERRQLDLERKRKALEAEIASMRAEFEAQETETLNIIGQEQAQAVQLAQERGDMGLSRKVDATTNKSKRGTK